MELLLESGCFPVGQLGPDFLLLKRAINHPPAEATLVVRVDQSERQWKIWLPEGMSAAARRVSISIA